MAAPFRYKPKHWWLWFKYRKQIKTLNKLADLWWETEGRALLAQIEHRKLFESLLFKPDTSVQIWWKD